MDGFVEVNDTSLTTYSTAIQNNSTVNLLYAHKINVVDELGNPITPTESRTVDDETVCFTIVNNAVYCPIILDADNNDYLIIPKDGYVTSGELDVPLAGTRQSQSAAQIVTTMTSANGLKFSHKVNIVNELGTALTPDTVTAGSFSVNCSIVTSTAYCPVLLAHDNNPSGGYSIVKDGYVEQLNSDLPLAGNRTAPTDAQQVLTMTTENGLEFGHRVEIVDELGNPLVVDSATAGEGADAQCVVVGSTIYCPTRLAADLPGMGFSLYRDGYVTKPSDEVPEASNRSSHTDPQVVTTLTNLNGMQFAYKITSINSEALSTDLTALATTVEVGDNTGRNTCTFYDGAWYCPVALAYSNGTMLSRVVLDGYVEKISYLLTTGNNRTENWHIQPK
jgi:hypothetical protein